MARRAFRKRPSAYRNEAMAAYGLAAGYLGLLITAFVLTLLVLDIEGG